ncbi:MAG: hypothetical protein V4819_03215 [Verrucomicrobiota bacterium]
MIVRPLLFGMLLPAIALAQEGPRAVQVAEPPAPLKVEGQERVTSRTGEFRVSGGEAGDRGAIAALAEEAKDELLRLTEEKDDWIDWKIPVSITLHGKSGDPMPMRTVAMNLLVSEVGYDLRLDVHLSRGIEQDRFKSAVTSALIYERALRGRSPKETDTPLLVPPWLVDGLREATAWRLDQSDRRLYQGLFKSGGLFKSDDLFALNEREFEDLDAASRAAFRVSSGALVMALLQQPQGKQSFRKFLTDVAAFEGEMPALLRKHFPELNLSETSLSKWWTLQLANIGARNLATDILTVVQTETELVDALRLNFRTAEGIIQQKDLSAWPEVAALTEPERVKSVQLAQDSLVRLSYRCFPSYRPILSEYQIALNAIAKNKTKDLAAKLTDLTERRVTMTAKAQQARDYLNWFEITRARPGETSGTFDDYIRLKDRLKANPHRRTDDLSRYLDRMDAIFSRKGDTVVQPSLDPTSPELPLELPPLELPK